jgi:hypothetical protein
VRNYDKIKSKKDKRKKEKSIRAGHAVEIVKIDG